MALSVYELDETYASITRPVVMSIIRQLSQNMRITKDIPIMLEGANGKLYTWNAGIQRSQDAANFDQKERIKVQFKEDYVEDNLITDTGRGAGTPLIFQDKAVGIEMYPNYSRQKVTVNFTYQARTRFQAESFRDNWRRAIAIGREYMMFFAEYTYPIPNTIEHILYMLYQLRTTYRDDYPTYKDYLFGLSTNKLTVLTNVKGEGDILAIEESQQKIPGNWNDSSPPEAEKDDKGSIWTISTDFEFTYDKVISIGLKYPISIDNQLIPPVLYPDVPFDLHELKTHFQMNQRWLYDGIMHQMGQLPYTGGAYIRIPDFDDWTNKIESKWWQPLLSALILVEPDVPRDICNLTDLGDWGLHPSLAPYFSKYNKYLTKEFEFPFYITLYTGDYARRDDLLDIDKELNVRTIRDMSVHKTYRLVIHCIKDIKLLTPEGQRRFFSNATLVNTWLDLTLGYKPPGGYPRLVKNSKEVADALAKSKYNIIDGYPINITDDEDTTNPTYDKDNLNNNTPYGNTWVDFRDFHRIVEKHILPGSYNPSVYSGMENGRIMSTVGIFSITAQKMTDLQ